MPRKLTNELPSLKEYGPSSTGVETALTGKDQIQNIVVKRDGTEVVHD